VVGASASLCGLLSALCALYSEEEIEVRLLYVFPVVMRAKYLLLAVALISMGGTLLPLGNVAHFAHLGGLVGGLVCLNLIRVDPLPPVDQP
jgi:membrane associated rhomboid family serine protease